MFDVKAGAIAAGAAFFISLLVGVFSHAAFPAILLRPLLFAVLFFIISALINMLVSRFLPELLDSHDSGEDLDYPGSRVDISEAGFPGQASVPSAPAIPSNYAQPDDSEDNLGNITDLAKNLPAAPRQRNNASLEFPGLDQEAQNSYNDNGISEAFRGPGASELGSASGTGDPVDALPDLDSLAGAFLPQSGEDGGETVDYSTPSPAKKPSASSKGQKMEGDFNPKDLAAGIRTILKKEG
ncbi:hypothetical protein [Leadbettera azotonutricia]|uniref:Uncharacterized protein n=1 Tax=Leadbettera azotonutricia (strain ATCC BAA-888 / DSM 13862 / ZAS-9) TaxID=545695 RepID=F5YEU5_LEAAZ|nr:hypothetical protein [Leadbettera azotonutricia]AEF82254.1 hypothetical protein TREAZ_0181 [Leadbettera azotonutricia ZAS-9]